MKQLVATARLIVVGLSFAGLARAAAQDEAQLQWLVKGVPDPAIIESHDGTGYYIYATGKGIAIWHSADLKVWKRIGRVFDSEVPLWSKKLVPGSDSVWAPDIHFVDGQYLLYYSVSTFGSQRSVIGLATNRSLDPKNKNYRWVDQGSVVESFPRRNDYNAIDPAFFADDDGTPYLYWGSYWSGLKAASLTQKRFKFSTTTPEASHVAGRSDRGPTSIEAPYVCKHGGFYYLFVSWDFCCAQENSTYKILVGRSRKPLGPFVDHQGRPLSTGGGKVVLMSDQRWRGPGHNSVLQSKTRGDWLVYHVVDSDRPEAGRILQLRPLQWKEGWPELGRPISVKAGTDPSPHKLVGRWKHMVDQRDQYDIFFEPNGFITGVKGEAQWTVSGDQLELRWKDRNAPGGFWIDRVQLSKNGSSYSGRNQNGTLIEGRLVQK
ncbi:MAG: arabinan endo-1,5-alpha-L-arabinosidase [Planctomycetota bacterium]|nr:arabinan endo-1,5-alpha-L-arabinosidase [Planctomycetota bacterium]